MVMIVMVVMVIMMGVMVVMREVCHSIVVSARLCFSSVQTPFYSQIKTVISFNIRHMKITQIKKTLVKPPGSLFQCFSCYR